MASWFSWAKPSPKVEETRPPAPSHPPVAAAPSAPPVAVPDVAERSPFSPRSLKQMSVFFVGATFLAWSAMVSRRAVRRKIGQAAPTFYQASPHGYSGPPLRASATRPAPDKAEGSLIAVEALGLATLNVMAFGIMMTGGLSWAFDVSSVDDLRRMARRTLGTERGDKDEDAERAVEEWVAGVLSRAKKDKRDGSPSGTPTSTEGRQGS